MRFGQVLFAGALALTEIRHCVEAEPVDASVEPALHDLQYRLHHARIIEVQVRLMREEAMPVISLRLLVPGPVRFFAVAENDARAGVSLIGVVPDVPVARARAFRAALGALEPRVLVRCVIDDQLGDHPQASALGVLHEAAKIPHGAEYRVDVAVIGDVVAIVAAGARVEGQQPKRGNAEVVQVIETFGEADEVADAVAVRILERLNMQLIDDDVLEPEFVIELLRRFSVEGRDDVHVGSSRHDNGTAAQDHAPGRCVGAGHSNRAGRRSRGSRSHARDTARFPARSAHRRSSQKSCGSANNAIATPTRPRRDGFLAPFPTSKPDLRSPSRAQTNSPSPRHVYHPAMRLPEMPPFLIASTARTPLQSVYAGIAAPDR